jgi:uracil-DNA glycosylase
MHPTTRPVAVDHGREIVARHLGRVESHRYAELVQQSRRIADVPNGISRFVADLSAIRMEDAFNFYADDGDPANERRRHRLVGYLESRGNASLMLVGEAPGYRGARVSGLPMTSERQIAGVGPAEATATIVQQALIDAGISDVVLLWNVFPLHPHLPGLPDSNRAPRAVEIAVGMEFLQRLSVGRTVVAVGRVAARQLGTPYQIRHPANGGKRDFREGLERVLVGLASGHKSLA